MLVSRVIAVRPIWPVRYNELSWFAPWWCVESPVTHNPGLFLCLPMAPGTGVRHPAGRGCSQNREDELENMTFSTVFDNRRDLCNAVQSDCGGGDRVVKMTMDSVVAGEFHFRNTEELIRPSVACRRPTTKSGAVQYSGPM